MAKRVHKNEFQEETELIELALVFTHSAAVHATQWLQKQNEFQHQLYKQPKPFICRANVRHTMP